MNQSSSTSYPGKQTQSESGSTSTTLADHTLTPIRQPSTKGAKPRLGKRTAPEKTILPARILDRGEIPIRDKAAGVITTQNLAELVWKYFEDEIHETVLEIQESLTAENLESRQKLTHRN